MPSVAHELPLDQPLYGRAELVEHRRNILRYARLFHRNRNVTSIDRLPCRFAPCSGTGSGSTHILLRAPAAVNLVAI
jgi:hypothetical protein